MRPRCLIATLLLLAACKAEKAYDAASVAAAEAAGAPQKAQAPAAAAPQPVSRMIIRNANVSVVVADAVEALRKVTQFVESRGGYVAEARQWKEHEQPRATATVRVPAAQLTPALDAIRGLAIRVESENISAQDVSQEYTDLGAQLRNLQATETELRELLTTIRQRTQKAAEVMEVYHEIARVRGEIEKTQGRMLYLSQMVAYSTITIELVPDVLAAPVVEPGWQPLATVKAASRSLLNSLKGLADAIIWVVIYLMPVAMIFIGFALLVRAAWRRLRRPAERAEDETPAPLSPG